MVLNHDESRDGTNTTFHFQSHVQKRNVRSSKDLAKIKRHSAMQPTALRAIKDFGIKGQFRTLDPRNHDALSKSGLWPLERDVPATYVKPRAFVHCCRDRFFEHLLR